MLVASAEYKMPTIDEVRQAVKLLGWVPNDGKVTVATGDTVSYLWVDVEDAYLDWSFDVEGNQTGFSMDTGGWR